MDLRIILPVFFLLGVLLSVGGRIIADITAAHDVGDPGYVPLALTITDATGAPVNAAVYVDDQQVALNVSACTLPVAVDGLPHKLRVEAPGYKRWSGTILAGRRRGRVKLTRLPPRGIQASRTPALAMA